MIGKCFSFKGKKYNVIILAGGAGTRIGNQSDYIPKALTQIGSRRAIDYIIERYSDVANEFIIGTSYHSDLLQSYIKGNFKVPITFTYENPDELKNNATSFMYCLDKCDSRYSTIVVFCDLIPLSNFNISDDSILIATEKTKGNIGTFRHSFNHGYIVENENPIKPDIENTGILGTFVFSNTKLLKAITYSYEDNFLQDITSDIALPYNAKIQMQGVECEKVFEFGTTEDIMEVRKLWAK